MIPRKIPMKRSKPLKRTPLNRVSPSKVPVYRQYTKLAKEFKLANPTCQCCKSRQTKDVHHMKGRGKYLLDSETFLAVCRLCHDAIHANPRWARENGWLD